MQSRARDGLRTLHQFLEQMRRHVGMPADSLPAIEDLAAWLDTLRAGHNQAPLPSEWGTFGVDESGDTNASTLKAAVASGENIRIPPGDYTVSSDAVVVDTYGQIIRGAGKQRTVLTAADAGTLIDVSNYRTELADFRLEGNNAGTTGLLLSDAARLMLESVEVQNFTGTGLASDVATGGNNNLVAIRDGYFYSNNYGVAFASEHVNQTTWQIDNSDFKQNTVDGLLLKETSHTVRGGNFEGNGAYGMRFGESSDSGTTTGVHVFYPYIETNTSGGIKDGKSARCVVFIESIMQGVDRSSGTDILEMIATADTVSGEWVIETGSGNQTAISGANLFARGTATDVDFRIDPKGAGNLLLASGNLELGSGGPEWISGSGAPSATVPNGSFYVRTDGAAGTMLYGRISGSWTALA